MSKHRTPLLFLLFLPLFFVSCSYKPPQYTLFSAGTVPFHAQPDGSKLCQEASLYMIADYYAQKIGWYDTSFMMPVEAATLGNIYNYLLANGGRTWYPYSQIGAPEAYSAFLYWHLDTYTTDSAYLMTHSSGIDALAWQLQNFQNYSGPLIATFQWTDLERTKHAVVQYAIRYDNLNKKVESVFYHDPYYGYDLKKLQDAWKLSTYLDSSYWVTMKFSNLSKGVK